MSHLRDPVFWIILAVLSAVVILISMSSRAQAHEPVDVLEDGQTLVVQTMMVYCPDPKPCFPRSPCPECNPCPEPFPCNPFTCEAADFNGDGSVGTADFTACSQLEDTKQAEACSALTQVYWGQECNDAADPTN